MPCSVAGRIIDLKGAFAALAGSYSELTRRLSRWLVQRADAQDVIQETSIRLARSAPPEDVANPKSYVARVPGNLAIDHMRTQTRLPPRQCEVFLMHKLDGLSHSEVASRLGISRSAVEKLVMMALASCRDGMGDLLEDE